MGFGLRNAGNTFQCMMDRFASGMPFLFVYLDYIIVGNWDIQSHVRHHQLLFERLRDYGLVISGEKCEFSVQALQKKEVEAILAHPHPGSLQDFYR
jgi:hypothetical protein